MKHQQKYVKYIHPIKKRKWFIDEDAKGKDDPLDKEKDELLVQIELFKNQDSFKANAIYNLILRGISFFSQRNSFT